ncbi:hypothetical protein GGX14DRAFT_667002 [Mycena pura]|uniref:Secreted protein n=1 Tax=Mycena pura TaxID=153505 RepID=A0AAD6V2S7_9AGAR|nr:hypothetical protein GGX14DRAFT_667002 [Mycena pura]
MGVMSVNVALIFSAFGSQPCLSCLQSRIASPLREVGGPLVHGTGQGNAVEMTTAFPSATFCRGRKPGDCRDSADSVRTVGQEETPVPKETLIDHLPECTVSVVIIPRIDEAVELRSRDADSAGATFEML